MARGGDPKAFLTPLEAAPGYMIARGYNEPYHIKAPLKGVHGYAPDDPRMLASLLIYGPPIGRGEIQRARVIDLAPTIAGWLGLDLQGAQGSPLPVPLKLR